MRRGGHRLAALCLACAKRMERENGFWVRLI